MPQQGEPDILPAAFGAAGTESPGQLLRALAEQLPSRTAGRVQGEVVAETVDGKQRHQLRAVIPARDNQRVELFSVTHDLPITKLTIAGGVIPAPIILLGAADFRQRLRDLFHSDALTATIASLMG